MGLPGWWLACIQPHPFQVSSTPSSHRRPPHQLNSAAPFRKGGVTHLHTEPPRPACTGALSAHLPGPWVGSWPLPGRHSKEDVHTTEGCARHISNSPTPNPGRVQKSPQTPHVDSQLAVRLPSQTQIQQRKLLLKTTRKSLIFFFLLTTCKYAGYALKKLNKHRCTFSQLSERTQPPEVQV